MRVFGAITVFAMLRLSAMSAATQTVAAIFRHHARGEEAPEWTEGYPTGGRSSRVGSFAR